MGSYVPVGADERQAMLKKIGIKDAAALFDCVPASVRLNKLDLPAGLSEMEVRRRLEALADENIRFPSCFRGAGAYRHYIPASVTATITKEEFVTAYTPYQAEISQGILQHIFEFQTMICDLVGLDVANASVYDGGSAAAEGIAMCREIKRNRALVSAGTNPRILEVIKTYAFGNDMTIEVVPNKADGTLDLDALKTALKDDVACVYLQQPSFFGTIEDASAVGEAAHAAGAKFVMGVNPIAMALLKCPGECGADVAVGEGQPLGLPLSWGGPYLGFMAATTAMMRKLPGRIVGQTVDAAGNRAFVLTLQAREQHIRREKASSNICSNENLCALAAGVYMACVGPNGLKSVAESCCANAHYLAEKLDKLGFKRIHTAPFFHEFATTAPGGAWPLLSKLDKHGILGGAKLDDNTLLWCATELNDKADIDNLIGWIEKEGK